VYITISVATLEYMMLLDARCKQVTKLLTQNFEFTVAPIFKSFAVLQVEMGAVLISGSY